MIKLRTIGGLDKVVVNPVLKAEKDVPNNAFITVDGDVYLVSNTITGDDAYVDEVVIKAGEFLNGYLVKSLDGLELVADEKHITYADGKAYKDIEADTTMMTVGEDGKLAVASAAPTAGVYFKVTAKCRLTGNAVALKVMVA